jgi:hypothetical protein
MWRSGSVAEATRCVVLVSDDASPTLCACQRVVRKYPLIISVQTSSSHTTSRHWPCAVHVGVLHTEAHRDAPLTEAEQSQSYNAATTHVGERKHKLIMHHELANAAQWPTHSPARLAAAACYAPSGLHDHHAKALGTNRHNPPAANKAAAHVQKP